MNEEEILRATKENPATKLVIAYPLDFIQSLQQTNRLGDSGGARRLTRGSVRFTHFTPGYNLFRLYEAGFKAIQKHVERHIAH